MFNIPPLLQALYDTAEKAGRNFQCSPDGVFDPCGLILEIPPASAYYWCTAETAKTFASTGGDGVHYSYLPTASASSGDEPIVMTMPANDQHNFVVAEGFSEFFGLGFFVGWFALEQIAYEADFANSYFNNIDMDASDDKAALMKMLREELKIKHTPLKLDRVYELTTKYSQFLNVPARPSDF